MQSRMIEIRDSIAPRAAYARIRTHHTMTVNTYTHADTFI